MGDDSDQDTRDREIEWPLRRAKLSHPDDIYEVVAREREELAILLPPKSRFRPRADGGVDETYRVNFIGALTPDDMRQVLDLLLRYVSENADVGVVALTKVEFLEPDTCDIRYWCAGSSKPRVNRAFGLWYRLHRIHQISTVDGKPYHE